MAIALIIAGGVGARTGKSVPKQFLTVDDVPLIMYTMKNIQDSGCYSELYVVCSDGWKDFIISYALQYNISIFKDTISGGRTRFESCYNGIDALRKTHDPLEIISILDGNRPLTSKDTYKKSIEAIDKADCVLPIEPCYDSMYYAEKNCDKVIKSADKTVLFKGQSPETSRLGLAYEICNNAYMSGLGDQTLTALMLLGGKDVRYIEGSPMNFKITTNEDFSLFKALKPQSF